MFFLFTDWYFEQVNTEWVLVPVFINTPIRFRLPA